MPQPLVWVNLKSTGQNTPTERSGHSFTTVGKYHILFGGIDPKNKVEDKIMPNNQIYTLRIQGDNCDWRFITCGGDVPLPRAHHSACAISQDRLFVFGGYYSTKQRFNDVYILRTSDFKWSQPQNQKSGKIPTNAESKIGAPEPRTNHTSVFHSSSNKVIVFGGHGGVGHQRRAFNDLHSFDCETSEWTKLEPNGSKPFPRGGHTAAMSSDENQMIIYGGWSNMTQFSDLYIYDIAENEWIDVELTHEIPRWYHSAVMVPAIPTWKFFVFGGSVGSFEEGGNRTASKLSDDTYVLDIPSDKNYKAMKWATVQLEEKMKPKPRENSSMIYDANASRLILFGGWSNYWIGDVWALSVSLITGPPYAIYSISPTLGPLTGKTKVKIVGDGFTDFSNIQVRFASGKPNPPEVQGTFISPTELVCETPSFEAVGPRKAEVRISISKGDYTITWGEFSYFLNTKASNSLAYGPGILKENLIDCPTIIKIQAKNTKNLNRESGADVFTVQIKRIGDFQEVENVIEEEEEKEKSRPPTNQSVRKEEQKEENKEEKKEEIKEEEKKEEIKEEEKKEEEKKEENEGQLQENSNLQEGQEEELHPEIQDDGKSQFIPNKIIDNNDGTYDVIFLSKIECEAEVNIMFLNENEEEEPIRGSPFICAFKEGVPAKNNEINGPSLVNYCLSEIASTDEFIGESRDNINIKNKNLEDVEELLKVKENLQIIAEKKEEVFLKLDIIEASLQHLGKAESRKDTDLKKCQRLKEEWNNLQKMAATVEKDISVPVRNESEKAKDNIARFEEQLKDYFINMKKESFYQYKTGVQAAMAKLGETESEIANFDETLEKYDYFSRMFAFPEAMIGAVKNLETIKGEKTAITNLWKHIEYCNNAFIEYLVMSWTNVDSGQMQEDVKKLKKTLMEMKGIDRKSNAYLGINDEIRKWATFLPLIEELKDPSMNTDDERHWKALKEAVKADFKVDDSLNLQKIWDLKLFEFKDQIEEITDQAKQELKMDRNLVKIIQKWKEVEFELIQHKDTPIRTLKMIEENFEQLEEHQLIINNMLLSKFVGFFEKTVEKWKQDLGAVFEVIILLTDVQKSWSFLENLFIGSDEVKKELPNESEQFVDIDREMKSILSEGCATKNVLKFCVTPGMLKRLEKIQVQLKVCEKALNNFLDGKKKAFPRFYFVSVADLLDILSNGNSPEKINKHMSKIYQAIETLAMDLAGSERPVAKSMVTCVGKEEVAFTEPLKLLGKVEVYLEDVITAMRTTLKTIAKDSLQAVLTKDRQEWIQTYPAQITLLVNAITWSQRVEKAFKDIEGGNLEAMKNSYKEQVGYLTDLIKMVQGDLDKAMRQKIMCLITMDTHSRDVIDKLNMDNVRKANEFQWQSQLKFYWQTEENDALCRIADASFWYSYEYLGNGPRLVVTALTDRIYVTATQALHLKMGCAPAGPAGTGKTETTKDLANALAKACYVFNCSGEMNYESMGNIFKGLSSSGCWGCFDEFNRLYPEVLSVCSVQFKAVTDAIKNQAERFILEGDEITLDPTCGVFITMNPGYLGRSELPEGLKALFRPITVVVPDLELICENMLMAEGFVEAKILARKFVTLYMLCKDLLSKADHYDWGLRAIKSVLVVAGAFKRGEPNIAEAALLMRALRDFNIPKIVAADTEIFFGLLKDLFPGIDIPRKVDQDFEKMVIETCKDMKLYPEPEFILKVIQLSELLAIRHCVFVMGPPAAGKSSTWKCLAKSQDKAGTKTNYVDLDPKVVSTKDLYGYNLPSKDWKDGLMSKLMRNYAELTDNHSKWLLLDGDLDANWIESMNSVMDDNRILTLANNERIPLKPTMRMLFEIRDLKYATPATVSRAGILYISDDAGHQWKSYVKSWIDLSFPDAQAHDEMRKNLQKMFDKYIEHTILWLKKNAKFVIPVSYFSLVVSLCKSLYPMLQGNTSNIEYWFIFSLVWSIGGVLTEKDGIDYRKEFSNWWKSEWKSSVKFPSKGTVFDYFVDSNTEGTLGLKEWTEIIQPTEFEYGMSVGSITIQTKETVASSEFIRSFLKIQHPVLLIGNTGCGKTQLAKGILREIVTKNPDSFAYQIINFNFYTDSTYLQFMLEQQLEKKAGRQFGPQGKVKLIYFVDDLNMPQLDIYNTQTAIALLRQHLDYGHWYDVGKLSLKDIINTQHLAAMNPSGGSFFVNPRYQRHFWTVSIPFPDNESLFLIYNTFLTGHLKPFKASVQEYSTAIIKAALLIHVSVVSSFRKTAINFHYEFNIRHIANVFVGLLMSNPDKYTEPERLVRLWIHESERTYGDRLVSNEHLQIYKSAMFDLVKKSFPRFNFSKYFSGATPEPVIFCDFTQGITGERYYDQIPNDKLLPTIEEALKEYNDNNAYMGLVLFEDALKHVCRVSRIVKPSAGHALLVGVGGSGRQSLSKLAAFIMGLTPYQITISAVYSMADLRTDLQLLYNKTGIKEEGILFLFTEGQITNERFLVYINDLLSSGEIAELYTMEEKEQIINLVRTKVKAEGLQDTRENCWNFFIDKVKQYLHMALCFSPVGDSFRRRARQFPALVNCTVIDWFQPWPYEALLNVAENKMVSLELGPPEIHEAIVKFMPFSFKTVNMMSEEVLEQERRHIHTTPKSFLELIQLYTSMFNKKRDVLESAKERYETGLVILKKTAEDVSIIEEEVKVKQVEAEEKKKEAEAIAEIVGKEKTKVEAESDKANIEAAKCATIKADVEEKKTSTQRDLDNAVPLIEQAKEALNSIKKKDFQTAKSWAAPPGGVPEVFAACIYLLAGHFSEAIDVDAKSKKPKGVDWKSALKLMKNPDEFLKRLIDFKDIVNANQVVPGNVAIVKNQYLSSPDFNPETLKSKSGAAEGLCTWVINIVAYWEVIQQVEPKRKALAEANQQFEEATIKLNAVTEVVRKLEEDLSGLVAEYDKATSDKNAAVNEAERCRIRLNLAQRLVSALSSENERWGKSIVELTKQLEVLTGDILLASAFISYAGPFSKRFREKMIDVTFMKYLKDNKIPMSAVVDPVKLMADEAVVASWNKQGLPTDRMSVENGTILTNSERFPLIIDPQLQGINWIREKEKVNQLRSVRMGTRELLNSLELAVENGFSVLIENMDENVEAILFPIISRTFIKRGKNKILKFAGKDLILSDKFRLFMHTKLSNPNYPPEIQAESTLINFTVTEDGLEDQLLSLVVSKERPDLAKCKQDLIKQQNDFKIKLKELEDGLLQKLASASGDFLSNIPLIENLENSKRIATEIAEKVAIAKVTETKINEASEFYRPAGTRGALLYFLLTDLAKIHSFYKYSLESYIVVIHRAIDNITEKPVEEVHESAEEEDQEKPPIQEPIHEEEQEKKVEEDPNLHTEQKEEEKKEEEEEKKEGEEEENKEEEKKEGEEEEEKKEGEEEKKEEEKKEEEENKEEIASPKIDLEQEIKEEEEQEIGLIEEDPLTPRSLKKRVDALIESITYTSFNYTRRGLFEKHKLIVSTMMCLRILLKKGVLSAEEVNHLILGKIDANASAMPDVLKLTITDQIWAACKALENSIPAFSNLCSSLETDILQWKKWYNEEKAEFADLPRAFKETSSFHRLLLLRAMRPDRLTSALLNYIGESLGPQYIEEQPFDIEEVYAETAAITPIFFVLFPGVDPTPDVEKIGATKDKTINNGKFINISMGQGQEKRAQNSLYEAAEKGNWIMLQNVHLMQNWLYGIKGLEGFLEECFSNAHPEFRCFISSEPPNALLPLMEIIPESILQASLKVANEAPQDLKANLRRAYNHFSQEFLERAEKLNEFKSILFGLCFFHAVVVGRKKFGSQGWSRNYNFNDGDLTICADVLYNYLSKYDQVPYDDLRYIYGDIMYGGHITDNWDRRTNNTYLKEYIVPELLQNMSMAPNFRSPDPAKHQYADYKNYIETKLPIESPQMFGLHPNAEIGYLTQQCDNLFDTIQEVQGGSSSGGGGAKDGGLMGILTDLQKRTPQDFNLFDINAKIKEKTPFNVICLQESERMNVLLGEIRKSLEDLKLGLTGALNMTDAMETLGKSLTFNKVPENWEEVAYFSKKTLTPWFLDLLERVEQLAAWTKEMEMPVSVCISYLFNPMSFLTAIMQNTAREKGMPLDNMTLQTDVTHMKEPFEVLAPAENGAYIHGMFLEGADWEMGSQGQQGYLVSQKPKILHPKVPVINVVAVEAKDKKTVGQYPCPVYVTSMRGPTYVFTANLQMDDDKSENQWILAGVCLLMSED